MTPEEIAQRGEAKPTGRGKWMAKCRAHEDGTASLSIAIGGDGRTLLKCHAGCTTESIVAAMGIQMRDLFPVERNGRQQPRREVATYNYTDEAGTLLYQVVRYDPKDFRQRQPAGKGEWKWGTEGVRRVLYHLPRILKSSPETPIWIVEGEKDADNLTEVGAIATTNVGGGGKWLESYTETLKARHVIICPDKDEPGRKHAELVAAELAEVAQSIRFVRVPGAHKDISDYLATIRTAEAKAEAVFNLRQSAAEELIDEEAERFDQLLAKRIFNLSNRPPESVPVYSIVGVPISTSGNLTTWNAAAKVGKTAVLGAAMASPMRTDDDRDTLGIVSNNPNGFALIHFDTEQSPEDHWTLISRVMKRAGRGDAPSWLRSFYLTGLSTADLRAALRFELNYSAQRFGGIHSVMIDGTADLVNDVNDSAECNALVAELHGLAIEYRCPIINVIHLNPGSDKSRGHLGSQLERKSESNLTLSKENEVTEIYSTKQRRAPILKGQGPRFRYCAEAGMHVRCYEHGIDPVKLDLLKLEVRSVFSDRPSMRYHELESTLMRVTKRSDKTAQRKIREYRQAGLIENSVGGLLVPKGL